MKSINSDALTPKSTLGRLGRSPKKGLGQHFLISHRVLSTILNASSIEAEDTVVEVGPGLGVLTGGLLERARRVVAIETDSDLASNLEMSLSNPRLEVVCADARLINIEELIGLGDYKLIANLPYFAATNIIRRFLECSHPPTCLVVMVQREVARNMSAKPGNMSLVSVGVQIYGRARIIGYVRPTAFYPKPKVTSAIIRIDVNENPLITFDHREKFFHVVRAGFSAKRKQLRNAFSMGLKISPKEAEELLVAADISPKRRAETLSLLEWINLYERYWSRS
jgi:16S rRNA (adenine1518-N6/adenine1519-N6)-dimethyltransferase